MALKLDNQGYNHVFRSFVKFAEQRVNANDELAIADAHVNRLGNKRILAITQSLTDEVHKWTRKNKEYMVNDNTRDIFKQAIIDIFGGESKIPESVKKAMLTSDYNCGKPLTARRIIAVKTAIDADGTAAKISLETFKSSEVKAEALRLGFKKSELPKLARTTHLYAQAFGVSEMDALRAVSVPGSKEFRLMGYGGRFLENATNFANGLRLMDSFAEWFTDIITTMDPIHKQARQTRDFSPANTLTKLNIHSDLLKTDRIKGLEKFVFEELASNPEHNLAGNDYERLFGIEHNAAMRFFARGYGSSVTSTIANIPPAKRRVIYAAYDQFTVLSRTAQEARLQHLGNATNKQLEANNSAVFIARLLRYFDKIEVMHRKGTLTARNILNKFFPDIRDKGNYDYKTVNDYYTELVVLLARDEDEGNPYAAYAQGVLQNTMNNCGTTIKETFNALRNNKLLPIPKMLCTASIRLEDFDGTTKGGRDLLAGDINRPANYGIDGGEVGLLKDDDASFGFTFPDGTHIFTNAKMATRARIPEVLDKIETLCGNVHVNQITSVMMMLSQAGLTPLRGGIPALNVTSNEHSAVDYTLSKNEKTGAITIKYSSPNALPFRFSWTATVDVDGNVTSTPMVIEKPVEQLTERAARTLISQATKKLGVNLTRAQTNEAVQLLRNHGTNMYAKNAKLFARFLVRLAKINANAQAKTAMATSTAASIRQWRDFTFGYGPMVPFTEAAKAEADAIIRDFMQPANDNQFTENIHNGMSTDAHRQIFIFNGTRYVHKPAAELIPAFKALVTDPRKQRALSSWLNQLASNPFLLPSNHVPYNSGVNAHSLQGFGSLVNRSMTDGIFDTMILDSGGYDFIHDLKISPDGNTATLTQHLTADLAAPGSGINNKISFGRTTITQRLVIDLSGEMPTVTDYKISQKIAN